MSVEKKRRTTINQKLFIGLCVSLVVVVVLSIGLGLCVSGINYYSDSLDKNSKEKQLLEQTISQTNDKMKEREKEIEDLNKTIAELQSKNQLTSEKLEQLYKKFEELKVEESIYKDPALDYPKNAKFVALTFDDGPGAYTEELLDYLKSENIKASFFVVGKQVEKSPDIIKRIYNEGHDIGNHSYSHKNLTKLSQAQQILEIQKCSDLIKKITGESPILMRPPGGNFNKVTQTINSQKNMRIIKWSVDTRDWESRNKQSIISTAFQSGQFGIRDGAIVLMHDIHRATIDAVPTIVERIKSQGYTIVSVSELLRIRRSKGAAGIVYTYVAA